MEYRVNAIFTMPTGYIGADIEEQVTFDIDIDDDIKDVEWDIEKEVEYEFIDWLDEQLADLRMGAYYEIVTTNSI